ncbi:MAG: radical SAM protein [Candidatus Krumholzibacteria bacterium]|nr:radical SAM protein [Candidatus Krumholzibacteria bacterium]
MIAYGPVPSRRLGKSLGVNNIPPKACTYACAYCQVGHTRDMQIERREFYRPEEIAREVGNRLKVVQGVGDPVDFLSFVPDGEPTLDVNLGREIELLRAFGRPIAVITNSSLLSSPDVRQELATADWVSLKVDSVNEDVWRRLNHPHRALNLSDILEGMMTFRSMFSGTLVTETMLVAGVNDRDRHAQDTAAFLSRLKPDKAYLAVPTRPPALTSVEPPDSETMVRYHDVFAKQVGIVEFLMGYEGNDFSAAGDPRDNLLGITAVHPMRDQAVAELLDRAGAPWAVVEELVREGSLHEVDHAGHRYYLRRPRSAI